MKLTVGLLLGVQAWAQWVHYPTAGVPRNAKQEPNLNAPAPRQGGRPDFSGIWTEVNAKSNCPSGPLCVLQMGLPPEARDIGVLVPGGLPYHADSKTLMDRRRLESSKDDPHARCTPPNFPRAYALPQFKKIVQTPGLLLMLHEFQGSFRQVFTDGRPLPEILQPAWSGYSSGKWEGDTLVIDSIGFRDGLWLDMLGNPLTDQARVTERLKRPNYGTLDVEVTINDPGAYTKPWTVKLNQTIVLDTELMDEICTENERSATHLVGGK